MLMEPIKDGSGRRGKQDSDHGLVRLGGAWARRDRRGQTFYTIALGEVSLLLLPNSRKTTAGDPDFVAFIARSRRGPRPIEQSDTKGETKA